MKAIRAAQAVAQELQLGGPRPAEISLDGETYTVQYDEDEDGEFYFIVSYTLPPGMYAELDGGSYGYVTGIRCYPDNMGG